MRDTGIKRLLPASLLALFLGSSAAWAADSASLQFTVPAPNPIQAGERIAFQALAINTGARAWKAGSYYWVAEVYDLDYKFLARSEQVSPPESVAAGAVAAISISFPVPETMLGRRLYKISLVKDTQALLESSYTPFQVLEKPIPEPPEQVDYRLEGNVTVSYKNSSKDGFSNHAAATTVNAVGKLKESSYLFNSYILHETGDVFDPFIILFTYYAPWGTVYGGDISPTLGQLSVNGQGLRGVMLEQKKDLWDWAILGGQTVTSQAGTKSANGRFTRVLYAAKLGRQVGETLKTSASYFVSTDEPGSLSTDPDSNKFRGPTLVPQKNSGLGAALDWEPAAKLKFTADMQRNTYFVDTSKPSVNDTAWRGEMKWAHPKVRLGAYVQRAGSNFVAFGAPATVGDRMTFNLAGSLYPASWYTLALSGNQYTDNLENDPSRVTTTQRVVSITNALQIRSATSVNLQATLNTARGKPQSALDNQTTIAGLGLTQGFGGHSLSLNGQLSQFRDKNKLASDLDTTTLSLSSSFVISNRSSASFGVSRSQTKDKRDGSGRDTMTVSPSYSKRVSSALVAQFWGTMTTAKNTSKTFPADASSTALNSELTWARSQQLNFTFGFGVNRFADKKNKLNNLTEGTISTRVSYSF